MLLMISAFVSETLAAAAAAATTLLPPTHPGINVADQFPTVTVD